MYQLLILVPPKNVNKVTTGTNTQHNMKTLSLLLATVGIAAATQISIACVGDTITDGVYLFQGDERPYPTHLQAMLGDGYNVTNLGASRNLMKGLPFPLFSYWESTTYTKLITKKWDIVVIMFGTNDAEERAWPHNCTGPNALNCPFSQEYQSMIDVIRTLGTSPGGPKIYTVIPPPLMKLDPDVVPFYMNETVINTVLPKLIPQINTAGNVNTTPIDAFDALGGSGVIPKSGCCDFNQENVTACRNYGGWGYCDNIHLTDEGNMVLAATVKAGLGL